jgi:hypothetical protein
MKTAISYQSKTDVMSVLAKLIQGWLFILLFHGMIQLHLNFVAKILLKFFLSFLLIHNKSNIMNSYKITNSY